jgi:hypothetical protein
MLARVSANLAETLNYPFIHRFPTMQWWIVLFFHFTASAALPQVEENDTSRLLDAPKEYSLLVETDSPKS